MAVLIVPPKKEKIRERISMTALCCLRKKEEEKNLF